MNWNTAYNAVTLIFAGLTVGASVVTVAIAADALRPPFLAPDDQSVESPPPTQAALDLPGIQLSWTPSSTPEPSITPLPSATSTATASATSTATPTRSPAHTPTITPTATGTASPTASRANPTATVTPTVTWTPSPTFTFTPAPTGSSLPPSPTLSPYPFLVQEGTPLLRENFATSEAGCNWQGLAGQAVTTRGEPVIGLEVRIAGSDLMEATTTTGSNTAYGPSGWQQTLGDQPFNERYRVTLWSGDEPVSPTVEIAFPGDCQQNLAIVNFVQVRPF